MFVERNHVSFTLDVLFSIKTPPSLKIQIKDGIPESWWTQTTLHPGYKLEGVSLPHPADASNGAQPSTSHAQLLLLHILLSEWC